MRRIAFRRILPITQFVFAAALVLVGNAQRALELAECEATIGWCLQSYDLPTLLEIALGINAPALLISLPIFLLIWAVVGGETWLNYVDRIVSMSSLGRPVLQAHPYFSS